ncbi:hypothetical protein O1611_g1953 [Lasiodiplodia mahajangana]|uniref:Uncharacterized protein n=1 Tax=Lasiodiplodia mahajangana TaxID=1108764 RepID=A0ACC2JWL7_9PEZI|nr:hypothetical protein O1611_g1953 [Lasiodiplodia mahajangana]
MSSPQSTTSGDAPKNNLEQITFRFCSECSNMLYPKEDEDSHKLMFTCRTCQYTEEATSSCVFRHVLNSAAGETAGVTQDVGSDPTVCGPVSSPSSDVHVAPASAAIATATAADSPIALCLRCGITLLHCDRCKDPASIDEYNDFILRNPDFAADRCVRYIQLANYWSSMDEEARDNCVDRFSSWSGLKIPGWSEETITQYLPMEVALDPEADPPEALGVEPSIYDVYDTPN